MLSISCPSVGNCAVGGSYEDGLLRTEAYVADELNGKWGTAEELPNSAKLNAGGNAQVSSVSCTSPGHCGAAGGYVDGSSAFRAFVATDAFVPAPTISRMSPSKGPSSGKTLVTIRGLNFACVISAHFGKRKAKIVKRAATKLKVKAPKGKGTVSVTVTTCGGTSKQSKRARYHYVKTRHGKVPPIQIVYA